MPRTILGNCPICSRPVLYNQSYTIEFGRVYHSSCLWTRHQRLRDSVMLKSEYEEIKNNLTTEERGKEKMQICSHCGGEYRNSDLQSATNGRKLCRKCKKEYTLCQNCGCYHEKDECYESAEGRVCKSCYANYEPCSVCGAMTNKVRKLDNEVHCYRCYEKYKYPVNGYHDSHSRSPKFFHLGRSKNTRSNLFLGVELEVDKGKDCNIAARKIKKGVMPEDFIFMETDGSLSSYGFENITEPATLEYHESIAENYKNMFKLLVDEQYRSHDTNTCGLHVHFNRDFFQEDEDICIVRLLYLVEKFWDNLRKFSRRTELQLDSWARRYNDPPEEVLRSMKRGSLGRYYAINLRNENTIEFRLFRGTLRWETFIATLQLVDVLVKKVKKIESNEELQGIVWDDFLVTDELKAYWETVKDRQRS